MKTLKNKSFMACMALFTVIISLAACDNDDEPIVQENLPDIAEYPIVGTNQSTAYNNSNERGLPAVGDTFYGQNANYLGNTSHYEDNGERKNIRQ